MGNTFKLNKKAIKCTDKKLKSFFEKAGHNVSMQGDVLVQKSYDYKIMEFNKAKQSVLSLQMVKNFKYDEPDNSASCKSTAELMDEQYKGSNVYYSIFFLTDFSEHSGSRGPFYIQLEGEFGVTDLHPFYPFVGNGQWDYQQIYDKYIGKIQKLRLAPGTSNGWGIDFIMIFYPREHYWLYPNTWIDSDGPNILQMSW